MGETNTCVHIQMYVRAHERERARGDIDLPLRYAKIQITKMRERARRRRLHTSLFTGTLQSDQFVSLYSGEYEGENNDNHSIKSINLYWHLNYPTVRPLTLLYVK